MDGDAANLVAGASNLLAARSQMAFTLGFHILLVPFGVCLPLFALIANGYGLRHDDEAALRLARRWSHVMGVTFAVGAVTGHRARRSRWACCGRGSWGGSATCSGCRS